MLPAQEGPADASPDHFFRIDRALFSVRLHEPPPSERPVPERLLHDLWRRQQFDASSLRTTDGRPLAVLDPGRLNTDGGPDFRQARLHLGPNEWRGDVEIHPASGGWFDHEHHRDARYNSTVLHVVLHPDDWTGGLVRHDGSPLPELVLAPHLQAPLRRLLHAFRTRPDRQFLCAPRWDETPAALRAAWIETMARERLEEKKKRLVDHYFATPDLEALLQERLFAGLGYAKNDDAMGDLARRLPLALCRRLDDPHDLEALALGAAGLLPAPADLLDADRPTADYATDLAERFERLQRAHDLDPPMKRTRWQFFRLRPANFPPLRIAQAMALLAPGGLLRNDPAGRLLDAARSEKPVRALREALAACPSGFWETHFRLEKSTKPRDPSVGQRRLDTLIANAVVPVLLLRAEQHADRTLEETAFAVLRALPAGRDSVTRRFRKLGTRPQNAFEAQGLHQLYRTRCTEARCLECAVGRHLLGR